MSLEEQINELSNEVVNFCQILNESGSLTNLGETEVITDKEVEDDSLNLIDMLLDTEKDVDPLKRRLVNIINKAVNDEATLDDIVEVVLKNKKKFQK